jgi:hypothetical protein
MVLKLLSTQQTILLHNIMPLLSRLVRSTLPNSHLHKRMRLNRLRRPILPSRLLASSMFNRRHLNITRPRKLRARNIRSKQLHLSNILLVITPMIKLQPHLHPSMRSRRQHPITLPRTDLTSHSLLTMLYLRLHRSPTAQLPSSQHQVSNTNRFLASRMTHRGGHQLLLLCRLTPQRIITHLHTRSLIM